MKFVIPGLNIKIFARAIHSLARIGDELFVEPSSDGVSFRTVNSSRSAFGSFFFRSGFFSLYDFKIPDIEVVDDGFKCKVAMKACLNAFKSVANIDKTVEKCRIIIDPEEDCLIVNMTCRHGINKIYNLNFIESETLQVLFNKSDCPFSITSQSRVLCDALVNFHSSQEEVILSVSPQKTLIRNYVDDEPDPTKAIHTELTLEAEEFDSYKVEQNCEITFCLKELRSLLSFSEPVNLPVSFVFASPGKPIIFFIENPPMFEANFVLATLASPHSVSQTSNANLSSSRNVVRTPTKQVVKSSDLRRPSENVVDNVVDVELGHNQSKRSSDYIANMSSRLDSNNEEASTSNTSRLDEPTSPKLFNKRTSSLSVTRNKSRQGTPPPIVVVPFSGSFIGDNECIQKTSKSQCQNKQKRKYSLSRIPDMDENHQTNVSEEDEIPGTPPAKRRRFFFKRCFEPTFNVENISAFNKILAEDSDEDT